MDRVDGSSILASTVIYQCVADEHELARAGISAGFEIVGTVVGPLRRDRENVRARVVLCLREEEVERCSLALIYVLSALSFYDARRTCSEGYDEHDRWTAADMLGYLRFSEGRLRFRAGCVRGRSVETTIEVASDGTVLIETINRGELATSWVDLIRGTSQLQTTDE